jgi:hypothetical protein
MVRAVERPIFFVGAPRSGTTVVFNVFAARPDLAWFSQHLARFPDWPSVTALTRLADLGRGFRKSIDRSDLRRGRFERLRVGPSEAYPVWERYCGERFVYDFMLGATATPGERDRVHRLIEKLQRYQGKQRFATKITGPARIGYLASIFPDAHFVHVIRDGRAVTSSLLRVHFWRDSWRERRLSWSGGVEEEDLDPWRDSDDFPLALAALQWAAIVSAARDEARELAPGHYVELRYEDFVTDPHRVLDEVTVACGLPSAREPHEFLDQRVDLRDMNYRWREDFDDRQIGLLDDLVGEQLRELGYEPAPSTS